MFRSFHFSFLVIGHLLETKLHKKKYLKSLFMVCKARWKKTERKFPNKSDQNNKKHKMKIWDEQNDNIKMPLCIEFHLIALCKRYHHRHHPAAPVIDFLVGVQQAYSLGLLSRQSNVSADTVRLLNNHFWKLNES